MKKLDIRLFLWYTSVWCKEKNFTRNDLMAEKNLMIGSLNDVYGEFLSAKQRRIVSAYYDEDLSLAEIAENEGITRQAVLDFLKRAGLKLNSLEEKYGYLKTILTLKELSQKVKSGEDTALEKMLEIIDNI